MPLKGGNHPPHLFNVFTLPRESKTLKITNSAIKKHLVGNKWSKSHFICPSHFHYDKKLTTSVKMFSICMHTCS